MKILFSTLSFILFFALSSNAQYALTVSLKTPSVGSTSTTVNASVSGIVSSYSKFDVIYGESAANLDKIKGSGVTFGSGVLLLSGFTLGVTLDSLKQQTKYYYKLVTNDSYQGITNRYTALDSFTTTKAPFKVSLLNDKVLDTSMLGTFIAKLVSTDNGLTINTLPNDANTGNKYFSIRKDSLFSAVKFDTLKPASYIIKINSLFSDNTSALSSFTISVLDKTPPVISTKTDTLNLIIGTNASVNVVTNDFNKSTADFKSNVTLSLSKYNFDCSNIGINKIDFIAKDDSLNTATKPVYVIVKDTIKPSLYVIKEKTVFLDSTGKAIISSADLETTSIIPDSLFTKNMTSRYLLDSGIVKNKLDTNNVLVSTGLISGTDRFGVKNGSMDNSKILQTTSIANDVIKVTTANPNTISVWAKTAYTPTSLTNFGAYQDYNGHRYFKSNTTMTWKQAKAMSDSLKGYIAVPNSSLENTFLKTLAGGSLTWIGVTDEITEGKYLTVLGDSIIYSNWRSGQPDNFNDEDYIHIDANGQWNDAPNTYLLNFIIEFDINTGVFLSKYQNLDAANSSFFVSASSVSGNGTNSLTFPTPDSVWNHFTYVLASGANNTKVFINGSLAVTGTLNYNSVNSASTPVFIGRVSGSPVNAYNGLLDDIRIYNKVLTDSQVIALYNYEKLKPTDRVYQTADNCSISQKVISQSLFSCSDLGNKTIKYSVLDKSANRVDSSINIIVKDTTKPIIKIKPAVIRLDNSAGIKLDFTDFDDGSSDNCAIETRVISKTDFTLKDTGQISVTYTLTDKSGNSKSTNVNVTLACKDPVVPLDQTIELCQASTAKPLQANLPTGSTGSLVWYTFLSGGSGNATAPTISTNNVSTSEYYVTHLLNGCESSKRAKISVLVKPIPTKPSLSRDSTGNLISSANIGNIWVKDGQPLSDSAKVYKPLLAGLYQVKNSLNGCSILSDSYYYIVTDLITLGVNEFIKVYPNPYTNKVNLEYNLNGYRTVNIDIIDITTGAKILSKQNVLTGTPLFLGQLSGGMYLLKVYTNDNKFNYQFKMIKI